MKKKNRNRLKYRKTAQRIDLEHKMWHTDNDLSKTICLTKYKSCSMCFVLEWCTEFTHNDMVLRLLLQRNGAGRGCIMSYWSKDFSHKILAMIVARLLYSASIDDLDTVGCFFELYMTILLLRKTQTFETDILSSISYPIYVQEFYKD